MTTHSTLKSFLTVEEVAELLNCRLRRQSESMYGEEHPLLQDRGVTFLFNEQKLLDWIAEKEMPCI